MPDPRHTFAYADADDEGFRFILPSSQSSQGPRRRTLRASEYEGGLARSRDAGHFASVVGRGGTGKSFFALQLVTSLLKREQRTNPATHKSRLHSAFYFTLEASPQELVTQVGHFGWSRNKRDWHSGQDEDERHSEGLYIVKIPSPAQSLSALNLQIRQSIARKLDWINQLVAIVIDPLGGVNLGDDLRSELSQLKELADSHSTYLFLLVEDHIFEQHASIEHFSQTVIRLKYAPQDQPPRSVCIQKARGQQFRSGFHQLELQSLGIARYNSHSAEYSKRGSSESRVIRVFPSLQAQSAYSHKQLSNTNQRGSKSPFFSIKDESGKLSELVRLKSGSVVLLVGPPGTFKQHIVSAFAKVAQVEHGSTVYISFKADIDAIIGSEKLASRKVFRLDIDRGIAPYGHGTYFLDARSPLLTPEEILFCLSNSILGTETLPMRAGQSPFLGAREYRPIRRAVVWGLRRLSDLPNFRDGRSVQFLEALVTLLKSASITSLLVDWPDIEKPSTLPVADLTQYVLLTRVCYSPYSRRAQASRKSDLDLQGILNKLWTAKGKRCKHVTLLRVQRTRHGFRRDEGVIFYRGGGIEKEFGMRILNKQDRQMNFENIWLRAGMPWERDLGLVY